MADLIDRQTAIETAIEAADKWDGEYSSEREGIIRKFFDKIPAAQPDHTADIGKKAEKEDCISRQAAIETLRAYFVDNFDYYIEDTKWIDEVLGTVPPAQPDHNADVSKKVSISCGHEDDLISRKAAIEALARMMPRSYTPDGSHPADEEIFRAQEVFADCIEALEILPPAQPEIIRCKDCIYYDAPHVENDGVRYEYTDIPAEAFDELGTGLVTAAYGINVGGRCCRDYKFGYSGDKRVFVPENNYCGRAERRSE